MTKQKTPREISDPQTRVSAKTKGVKVLGTEPSQRITKGVTRLGGKHG